MINIGKYLAAARGGPNVAAKAMSAKTPIKMAAHNSRKMGSMAGYEGGRSAWIQMEGSGYGMRPRNSYYAEGSQIRPYAGLAPPSILGSNYRKPDYSRVTGDQDLSRLI